jgi:hypothetical protein
MNGVWMVTTFAQNEIENYEIVILDGLYITKDQETAIEHFFFDTKTSEISFQRVVRSLKDRSSIRFYNLTLTSDDAMNGSENGSSIDYHRIASKDIDDTINEIKHKWRALDEEERIRFLTTPSRRSFWNS